MKKLLLIVLLGLSAFAVWRKVKADRAELDLWTEATPDDVEFFPSDRLCRHPQAARRAARCQSRWCAVA